jgi:hypothetical protein
MTWTFNHTGGSLLIMMLLHTSVNVSLEVTSGLFPGLPNSNLNGIIGFGLVALLIVLFTRGRLGYQPEGKWGESG